MSAATVVQALRRSGVVPVVRTPDVELAQRAVSWLSEAGVETAEITLTIPDALDLIARLRARPALLVGAGTVRSLQQARLCIDAGAAYLVSPVHVEGLAGLCAEAGIACIAGALTPSEIHQAQLSGANAVKVFPVDRMGGAGYVRILTTLFPELTLMPTGGIAPAEVGEYLAAGAAFCGVGGKLVDVAALRDGQRGVINVAVRAVLSQVAAHRVPAGD